MENLKRDVKKEIRESSKKIIFENIEYKYKSEGFDFIEKSEKVGRFQYVFVSEKFAEFGSEFGIYIEVALWQKSGQLNHIIEQLALSYKSYQSSVHRFGLSSLSFQSNKFYKKGTVSFFEKDNIEEKCKEVVSKVKELFVPKIQNFIDCNLNVIEDILEAPENYGFPMAYALTICYLNKRLDLVDEVIKKGKSKKLYDSTQIRIDEIINKLNSSPAFIAP